MFYVIAGSVLGGVIAAFISLALGWPVWPGIIVCSIYTLGVALAMRKSF